jgi:hypothetical protein
MTAKMAPTSLLVTASIVIMVLIRTTACDVECKGVLNLRANGTVDSLESPDFFHSSNLGQIDCEAHISANSKSDAVVLELIYFKISGDESNCTNEYLEVYDGPSTNAPRLRKMCGKISYGHFKSANSDLTVVFHSDGMQNKTGFTFNFFTRQKTNSTIEPCTNVSLVANETVQFLLSPNYPDWYPSNTDCKWHITTDSQSTVVVLKPAYFELERRQSECKKSDFVSIYDGPSPASDLKETVCGSNIFTDQYRSSDSSMTIVFHSDGYNNYKGFNFTYQSQEKSRGNSGLQTTMLVTYIPIILVICLMELHHTNEIL